MISKNRIKEIKALAYKKNRAAAGLFVAEGRKLISEILHSNIKIEVLITTSQHLSSFQKDIRRIPEIAEASEAEIKSASMLQNPQGCIAICRIPYYEAPENAGKEDLILCLDEIQDPGNMGTIIRLSDWFGITDIFCSPPTVDLYNPKTVQATMGAICRVRVHYVPLKPFLEHRITSGIPVYGTCLNGKNIYEEELTSHGAIVLGNEGNGISPDLFPLISDKITVPEFGSAPGKAESLNVSVAAAIIVSEFRRRIIQNGNKR
jgi:RNA methyltransferase, TrmH family